MITRLGKWFYRHLVAFIFIGIWVLVMMFIHYGALVAQNARDAKTAADNTKTIVDSQTTVLQAIQQAQRDNRLDNDQRTNLIICLIQIPLNQRTDQAVNGCRQKVNLPTNSPAPNNTNNPMETNAQSESSVPKSTTSTSQNGNSKASQPGPVTQSVQAINRDVVQPTIKFIKGIL